MANDYFDKMTNDSGVVYDVQDSAARSAIALLQAALNTLMGADDVTDEIDTYNEIKDFLDGFDVDDPTLSSQLTLLNTAINNLTTALQDKANASALQTAVSNLQAAINGKVTAENGKGLSTNDYTNEDKAAVATIANKANSADVYTKSQTYNKDEVGTMVANAGSGAVSVTTNQDGTFTIHVGENDYTINLNHTHENMAKIVKCTEATRPQTLENDTIYVQVDNATTPTEIESLWLFGLEFTGGGVPAGTPRLTSPKATVPIDLGQTVSGTASATVTIKGRDLTQSLVVEFGSGSTGYSFDTSDLHTGVTYDSVEGTLTITKEAACAINGVDIVVVYTGSDTDENAAGTLGISSVSADGISVEVALITNKVTIEELAAVKLNGTQWMKTDYYPNPKTEFDLVLKFDSNSNTSSGSSAGNAFLRCFPDGSGYFYASVTSANALNIEMLNQIDGAHLINVASGITQDNSVFSYKIGTSTCSFSFIPGGTGTGYSHTNLAKKTNTETNPLAIGLIERTAPNVSSIFNRYDLTIYRFTIYEDGVAVRDFVPRKKNGVTGLLDVAENGSGVFLSSGSSSELVPVPLTQSNS